MRVASLLLAFLAFATSAPAQDSKDDFESKRDKKLEAPFLARAAWITDYDKALADAKKSGKIVFAYITRSYAPCGPCTNTEKTLFDTDDFATWSKDFVLLCHITTRIAGEKYPDLLQDKGGRGFPYLVFLDAEGRVIAAHKGKRTIEDLRVTGKEVSGIKGDPAAPAPSDEPKPAPAPSPTVKKEPKKETFEDFSDDLEDGLIETFAEALERLKAFGDLTKEQKERIAAKMNVLEGWAALKSARRQTPTTLVDAGKTCAAMRKDGRIPTGDKRVLTSFWLCILEYSQSIKDVPALTEAIAELDAIIGGSEGGKTFIAEKKKALEALKPADKATEY